MPRSPPANKNSSASSSSPSSSRKGTSGTTVIETKKSPQGTTTMVKVNEHHDPDTATTAARQTPMTTRGMKARHKRNRSISRLPSKIEPDPKLSKNDKNTSALAPRTRSHAQLDRSKFSIRPMELKDVATVFHLGNAIFTASEYPNMYRTWDDFAVVDNYDGSGEFCFVVEHKDIINNKNHQDNNQYNGIIAFLLGETVTKAHIGTRGYIQWVAVLPAYRRLGIATDLINEFVKVAKSKNISLLLADTPADNEPSIGMFQKAGLNHKTDHVYLTRRLGTVTMKNVDPEDMSFRYTYTAKKTKQRVTIRNMKIDDLDPIYKIGERIFTEKSANLYNFWDESVVLQSFSSDPEFCVVATVPKEKTNDDNDDDDAAGNNSSDSDSENEEVVVGFAFGETIEKPRSSWKYGYLVWLGCAPEYQGIGLAYQLYNTMAELFAVEKVRMVMIDTQQNNEGALKFFRKLGFGHDEEHIYLTNVPMLGDGKYEINA